MTSLVSICNTLVLSASFASNLFQVSLPVELRILLKPLAYHCRFLLIWNFTWLAMKSVFSSASSTLQANLVRLRVYESLSDSFVGGLTGYIRRSCRSWKWWSSLQENIALQKICVSAIFIFFLSPSFTLFPRKSSHHTERYKLSREMRSRDSKRASKSFP